MFEYTQILILGESYKDCCKEGQKQAQDQDISAALSSHGMTDNPVALLKNAIGSGIKRRSSLTECIPAKTIIWL